MATSRKQDIQAAVQLESKKFEQNYLWIEKHLPPSFFEDADSETAVLVAHSLMDLDTQDYFSHIHFKNKAIALCLDSADADLQILRHYRNRGIKNYRTFVSNEPPPFLGISASLRVAVIDFTGVQEKAPEPRFQKLLERARERDPCQLEVVKTENGALQIVLAWRNVPKHNFIYRLTQVIYRHGFALKKLTATYVDSYHPHSVLLMALDLHGTEEADIDDFLQELVTVKYFPGQEIIETTFVNSKLVRGNIGNLIKTLVHFIHQVLVHADPNLYSFANIEEGLCRHPELTVELTRAFEAKFDPKIHDLNQYNQIKNNLLSLVDKIDTGQEANDNRRKNVLRAGINFVEHCLKTNFYRPNKTAFSFRLDPRYLDSVPYNRIEKFPELPFAVFFMKGMYFIGFHIRFRDLARGGLRTVYPSGIEQLLAERNNVFSECYNLAYTQQKKNKDIPEGGAKGVILLEPYDPIEEEIYRQELAGAKDIEEKITAFRQQQKLESLLQSQRSYIESFVTILNCDPDGKLRPKDIVDYYQKPEYIYLGPDENMSNEMIVWISNYAKYYHYKPGSSFMSSKPGAGINHKEYGVTSRGVNIYMEEVLKFLSFDPKKDSFTVKMTGGPDGDVAGNEMYNLYQFYPKTAKLVATIDVSGTIFDPNGLDLKIVTQLFKDGKPIRFYPAENLSEGGFLLDTKTRREQTVYVQQTLLLRKQGGKVIQEWISGNEMNHILRTHVHQVKADVFIPGGGRPRTLNDNNYRDFLDETGKPTSKAIIEGGNLYLTPGARRALEKLGVIIIKDSSANKGGVICSSFEVLGGLTLSEEEFIQEKPSLVQDILAIIEARSRDEAAVLLASHGQAFLTDVSEWISERINAYTDELMAYLIPQKLSENPNDPLIRCLLNYCPPTLRNKYQARILKEVPDMHKKAIIACFLAQRLVYRKGLSWSPSIVDVLPLIVNDPLISGP